MKIYGYFFLLIISVSAFGQTKVNISGGSGDGIFRGQQLVDIWADPNPPGQIFDRWTGDTDLLQRTDEWHTKIKTGRKNLNLTAAYKNVAAWTPGAAETIGTSQMRYYFPPIPVGVVFHFHGSGGNLNGLFTQPEQIIFAKELVAEGYAVVSLNSEDRVNAQWSTAPLTNNPDVINVQSAVNSFISRGFITAQTPIFASGISNGGAFAPRVSFALNFRGTAIYIATSNAALMSVTNVPTIWNIMQNDTVLEAGSVQTATASYDALRNRGIRAELNLLRPSPVYPERFRRIPNLSAGDSVNIYNALKINGFLDERNYLKQNPGASGWQSVIPAPYSASLGEIGDQLFICFTEHKFFSDYNRRVINFFNSLR